MVTNDADWLVVDVTLCIKILTPQINILSEVLMLES